MSGRLLYSDKGNGSCICCGQCASFHRLPTQRQQKDVTASSYPCRTPVQKTLRRLVCSSYRNDRIQSPKCC